MRPVALALALACGLTTLAEAKKSSVVKPAATRKIKAGKKPAAHKAPKAKAPKLKPQAAKAKFKPPKAKSKAAKPHKMKLG
jgi:hypothetical protein